MFERMRDSLLLLVLLTSLAIGQVKDYRPPLSKRTFNSTIIEKVIDEIANKIKDPTLSILFRDCFPNTLDTTVRYTKNFGPNGKPDTFIITGDIFALWLRDSTNQVLPYVEFASQDEHLQDMFRGLIYRHTRSVLHDPYANSFNFQDEGGPNQNDIRKPPMTKQVFEGKYELDSLAAVLKLAYYYYEATGDISPFDSDWLNAIDLVMSTIEYQQAGTYETLDNPQYTFLRETTAATDTLMLGGLAAPGKRNGMSKSPFRPSDDSCTLPFPIGANAMASIGLGRVSKLLGVLGQSQRAIRANTLANEIAQGILQNGIVNFKGDSIFAYEVDGYGNQYFMDDANIPGLLSLPYLGFLNTSDSRYQLTRKHLLSSNNPYYFEGKAGKGIGGPHVGLGYIWPMSIIIQALTSTNDQEIQGCLNILTSIAFYGTNSTTGQGYGFMHESFWKDDASQFTRPWFAWANSLFGELILTLSKERPHLLF